MFDEILVFETYCSFVAIYLACLSFVLSKSWWNVINEISIGNFEIIFCAHFSELSMVSDVVLSRIYVHVLSFVCFQTLFWVLSIYLHVSYFSLLLVFAQKNAGQMFPQYNIRFWFQAKSAKNWAGNFTRYLKYWVTN